MTCLAARLYGVINETGEVYPCEMPGNSMGGLRDFNYDFTAVWKGDLAKEIREKIKNNYCQCIHECHITTNYLFNPKYYPGLLWMNRKISKSKNDFYNYTCL